MHSNMYFSVTICTVLWIAEHGFSCGHLTEQIKVIGSYGAKPRQDLPKLVRLAETVILNISDAVSRKYKFEEAVHAFHDLDQGSIVDRAVIEIS
ncbi:hypothetical protein SO802_021865 [Lithocarpus litseifolius]|uniref:Uncharacterized protein n=1 Tax=Lithocarpus litseifolius TaxID=425828 RepID=A0AAW2CG03_9ROSI